MKKILLFILLCGCSKPETTREPIKPLVNVKQTISTLRDGSLVLETEAWATSGQTILLRLTFVYESGPHGYVCCSIWNVREMTDSVKRAQYLLVERQALEYLQKRTPYHP